MASIFKKIVKTQLALFFNAKIGNKAVENQNPFLLIFMNRKILLYKHMAML
jgi:hypothetical protein